MHHVGYDQRRGAAAAGQRVPSPLDDLARVVEAVGVPVQAVGGLSVEQAMLAPELGSPLVVLGAPLTIDAAAFKTASGDLSGALRRSVATSTLTAMSAQPPPGGHREPGRAPKDYGGGRQLRPRPALGGPLGGPGPRHWQRKRAHCREGRRGVRERRPPVRVHPQLGRQLPPSCSARSSPA